MLWCGQKRRQKMNDFVNLSVSVKIRLKDRVCSQVTVISVAGVVDASFNHLCGAREAIYVAICAVRLSRSA